MVRRPSGGLPRRFPQLPRPRPPLRLLRLPLRARPALSGVEGTRMRLPFALLPFYTFPFAKATGNKLPGGTGGEARRVPKLNPAVWGVPEGPGYAPLIVPSFCQLTSARGAIILSPRFGTCCRYCPVPGMSCSAGRAALCPGPPLPRHSGSAQGLWPVTPALWRRFGMRGDSCPGEKQPSGTRGGSSPAFRKPGDTPCHAC